ncbi:MAG: RNA methyltransferase [Bacilli bacterium]
MFKEITSSSNAYIKNISSLKEKKYRVKEKKYLIEGFHLVMEAYKAGVLNTVLFTRNEDIKDIKGIDFVKVTSDIISKLSYTKSPQNIMGICDIKDVDIDYTKKGHILILDDIADPGNTGTLIRSALGLGIDLIIMSSNTVDIYNDKVIRSTQGAIFHIDIIKRDLVKEIENIKSQGIKVFGTSLKSSAFLTNIVIPKKYAIVLGNEAQGMRAEIEDLCEENIKIKIDERLESLNVAIAGSIVMHHFFIS